MTNLVLLREVLLAVEGLAASALLLIMAWLTASCFPRRAALRHMVWLAAFVGLLILPALALLPTYFVIRLPAVSVAEVRTTAMLPTPVIAGPAIARGATMAPVERRPGQPVSGKDTTWPSRMHIEPDQVVLAIFALWLAGLVAILLYRTIALLGLGRLRRRSTPKDIPAFELQGRWQLRIATEPGIHGPLTWGIFRPIILLPQDALRWPRERLVAVLRHEIAHVRRHDMLTQMLSQFVCAFYWPNPLVWCGAWRLRQEAEIAADDAVLSSGIKPSLYAETLMDLAAVFRGASPGIAMAAPSTLEARVTSVLAVTQSRSGVTVMDAFKTACLGTAAITLIALARPDLANAQVATPSTPVSVAPTLTPMAQKAVAPEAHKAVSAVSPAAAVVAQAAPRVQTTAPPPPLDHAIQSDIVDIIMTVDIQGIVDIIMTVNIQGAAAAPPHLQLSFSLELENEERKAAMESLLPRVKDQFQAYLRELRVEDLKGSSGVLRIKEELLRRANVAAAPYHVRDVLLKEMLVQ